MEMTTDFLPIGSVVLLEEGTKKLMITGFCIISEDSPEEVYDYCGCIYPEGVLSSDENYVFDQDQIQEVLFIGYEDKEQKEFKTKLTETLTEMYEDDDEEENIENETIEKSKIEEIERL